jgi:hypothetical protein
LCNHRKYKASPVLRSPQPLKVSPKAVGVASPHVHTPMTPGMLDFNRTLGVASRFGSGALGNTDGLLDSGFNESKLVAACAYFVLSCHDERILIEYSSPITPGLGFSPKGLGYLPAYELSPSNCKLKRFHYFLFTTSPLTGPGTSMSGMSSPHFAEAADHTHANAIRKQTYMVACKYDHGYVKHHSHSLHWS